MHSEIRAGLLFDEDWDFDDPPDASTIPSYQSYYIYCDETCIQGGSEHFGWGSLWIPSNRTGDIGGSAAELGLGGIKKRHGYNHELKWTNVTPSNVRFFCDVVDWFFQRKWMMFHGIVVRSRDVNWRLYPNKAAARVFFLSELLRAKLQEYDLPGQGRIFRVRVDPLPIDYAKEHEKIERISNAILKQRTGNMPIRSIKVVKDSQRSAGIQICDLLVGAWVWSWNSPNLDSKRGRARREVAERLASWLRWQNLCGATFRTAWKFNGWYFKPKEQRSRRVLGRRTPPEYENIEKWRSRPAPGR